MRTMLQSQNNVAGSTRDKSYFVSKVFVLFLYLLLVYTAECLHHSNSEV